MPDENLGKTLRVWDLPTRLFHWALVLCFVAMFVTGSLGGEFMPWHAMGGYCVISLLFFRVLWGFFGGHWSRFKTFRIGPQSIRRYLGNSGNASTYVGHNPLGALSIIAMLSFLAMQFGSGLFSEDKADFFGPLTTYVSQSTVSLATWYHKRVGQRVLLGLIALHIGAIAYYRLRHKLDLLAAMFTGNKTVSLPADPSRDDAFTRTKGLALFILCCLAVVWFARHFA